MDPGKSAPAALHSVSAVFDAVGGRAYASVTAVLGRRPTRSHGKDY